MTTVDEIREQLAVVPLFARCHPSDLRIVASRCDVRDVAANTVLIHAGEMNDEFFVLLSGSAERGTPDEPPIRKFGPGDYFGELAVLDPAPRSLDVVTTSDSVVAVLTRPAFLTVLDAVPGVSPQLLQFMARRLRAADLHEDHEANEPLQ
jgi:CRP-like cAMP-binding protein